MTAKLIGPLKRELQVNGKPYTLTIAPDALKLTPKGRRKGYQLAWKDFVSGEAALAVALNASLARGPTETTKDAGPPRKRATGRGKK